MVAIAQPNPDDSDDESGQCIADTAVDALAELAALVKATQAFSTMPPTAHKRAQQRKHNERV